MNATLKPELACPSCSQTLSDFAVTCGACDMDLIRNESRSPAVLAKSINRKDQSVFFYVSPLKLYVMSLVTFGFYELFWFYKNWSYVNEHSHKKVFPLLNSIFSAITFYGLIKDIAQAGAAQNRQLGVSAGVLAFSYFLLAVLSGFISLVVFLVPVPLVIVQSYINSLNSQSPTPINDRFSIINWVAIVLLGGLMLLGTVSKFLPTK